MAITKTEIRLLVDACFVAKRIIESMQELPHGMKPRHIHVIECIFSLGAHSAQVRVSDVSARLGITMPSITKLIQELEEMSVLLKRAEHSDKRVSLLTLTELGLRYYDQYVEQYHTDWARNLDNVTAEQARTAIAVIESLKKSMPKGGSYVE